MDELDKKILQQLEKDSRQSYSSIAKKIGSNKNLVNYRIEKLQKNKIIKGFQYISNQRNLGRLSFGLLIKFKDLAFSEQKIFLQKLEKMKQVSWTSIIEGKWDLIIVIIEKNIDLFNEALKEVISLCENKIEEYNFYADIEGLISGHDYLYSDKQDISVVYRFQKELELKKSELSVYKLLKENPRISLLQIANKLNTTYDTVKTKFNHLKSEKILLRCSPKINIEVLGYKECLCLLNVIPSTEKFEKLIDFCAKHPNIIRYSKCLGNFNLILNIHYKDSKHLKEILCEIKQKNFGMINSYEIIQPIEII